MFATSIVQMLNSNHKESFLFPFCKPDFFYGELISFHVDQFTIRVFQKVFSDNISRGSNNLRNGESPEKVVGLLEQIVDYVANTQHKEYTRLILCSLVPSPETEERTHEAFVQFVTCLAICDVSRLFTILSSELVSYDL